MLRFVSVKMEGNERTERCRDADDQTFPLKLFGQVDLVPGGSFDEVDIRDAVTGLDKSGSSGREGPRCNNGGA